MIASRRHASFLLLAATLAAGGSVQAATGKPTYASKMEMGQLLMFNGDLDRAIRDFEQAAELNPKAVEPHTMLLNAYAQKGGPEAMDKAATECREILERKPTKDIHWVLGNLLKNSVANEPDPEKQKAKLSDALKEFQEAQNEGYKKSMCEYAIAMIDLQNGETDKAMSEIEGALAEQPDFADGHLVHAVLMFKNVTKPDADNKPKDFTTAEMQKKLDGVLDELDTAIKQKANNAEAHSTKGEILLALGRLPQSLNEYHETTKIEPRYQQAWVGIATIEADAATKATERQQQLEHLKRAQDAFDQLKKLNPNDKNYKYSMALLYEKLDFKDEAVKEFEKEIQTESDPVVTQNVQAHINQLRGIATPIASPLGGAGSGIVMPGTTSGVGAGAGMFTGGALQIPMKDLIQTPDQLEKKKQKK